MKMMRPLFAGYRITAMRVEAGPDTLLHRLYYLLILQLNRIESRSGAGIEFRFIGNIGQEGYFCRRQAQRVNNVDRQAPGIEIEHRIWENEKIVGRYFFSIVG